jgi:hypothetical protein
MVEQQPGTDLPRCVRILSLLDAASDFGHIARRSAAGRERR